MYQAGIHCEGCHFLPQDKFGTQVAKASEVSCMSCHGARYNKILGRWKSLIDVRLEQAKSEFNQARSLSPGTGQPGPLADAFANIQFVDRGVGIHNVEYSLALLDASHNFINKAREEHGLRPIAKKWAQAPFESSCFRCHRGIEQQSGRVFGINFVHRPHIASGFECATCHRPHEDKPAGEVLRFGREGCANCHHQREQQKPESCLRCHTDLLSRKIPFKGKQFDHSSHFKDLAKTCADCHLLGGSIKRGPNMKTCESCHPSGF
jgi:class III cytochrome C family protein